jgi:hypothetical protein
MPPLRTRLLIFASIAACPLPVAQSQAASRERHKSARKRNKVAG